MMNIWVAGLAMIVLAACAASPKEKPSIEPLAKPVSLLKIGFVASTPEEEKTATEVRQGTRAGLIAYTASGGAYPLPGYINLSGNDLQQGLHLGYPGKPAEAAFAYESDLGTITLIYVHGNQLQVERLMAPSDTLLHSVELPVAPFLAGLRDNQRQSIGETVVERDKMLVDHNLNVFSGALAGMLLDPMARSAFVGFPAVGLMRTNSSILKDPAIVHWNYNNGKFELVPDAVIQPVSFGYTRADAERWIVESYPAGARIIGLDNGGEPKTNTTITNLRASDAVKLTMVADGYRPCLFTDAQRSIVSYHGLEWIRLFCTLNKAN